MSSVDKLLDCLGVDATPMLDTLMGIDKIDDLLAKLSKPRILFGGNDVEEDDH